MIENIGGVKLTDEYWDCECEKNFIHPRSEDVCTVCEAQRENQPNSHVTEVLAHGFIIKEQEQTTMDIKELALEWIKNNIKENEWLEDEWVSLTDEYDLNVYIDDDGKKRATIFPVIDGETNLETFIEVLE